jgi:predicted  nucleic acid-binding Zn-ribbon protein
MVRDVQSTIQKTLTTLHAEKAKIDRQISTLQTALAALSDQSQRNGTAPGHRRKMSADARKAIGRRMKAYWAKRRADAAKGKAKRTR